MSYRVRFQGGPKDGEIIEMAGSPGHTVAVKEPGGYEVIPFDITKMAEHTEYRICDYRLQRIYNDDFADFVGIAPEGWVPKEELEPDVFADDVKERMAKLAEGKSSTGRHVIIGGTPLDPFHDQFTTEGMEEVGGGVMYGKSGFKLLEERLARHVDEDRLDAVKYAMMVEYGMRTISKSFAGLARVTGIVDTYFDEWRLLLQRVQRRAKWRRLKQVRRRRRAAYRRAHR